MADTFLNVCQKDGTIVKYAFADKPVLVYSGANVVISTDIVSVEYPVKELSKITFEEIMKYSLEGLVKHVVLLEDVVH